MPSKPAFPSLSSPKRSDPIARYSPKQIEKYKRQRYIAFLEKVTKNLFRMLRKETMSFQEFSLKFKELMQKGESIERVRLDTEYLREMERYVDTLFKRITNETMDERAFAGFKEEESTNLNRLQKMKNTANYKKEKHKKRSFNDGWE